jgi:hypothetical protein
MRSGDPTSQARRSSNDDRDRQRGWVTLWVTASGEPLAMWQPHIVNVPDPDADTDLKTQGSRSDCVERLDD